MKRLAITLFAVSALTASGATTWSVDKTTGNDDSARADTTGATPFLRLQAAIDNAKTGDTILVGPGVYGDEEGVTEDTNGRSRISIGKQLILRASDPTQETAIVGRLSTETTVGIGSDAVRCLIVKGAESTQTVIEGLTLRNGGALNDSNVPGRSGGVYTTGSNAAKANVYLLNCTISNCVSKGSGAVYYGTLIGCRVTGCRSTANVCAAQNTRAYFTLFDNNAAETYVSSAINAINCTFFKNTGSGDLKSGTSGEELVSNCLFSKTVGAKDDELTKMTVSNLVAEADGESMVDPANGDFRVRGGGVAFRKGDADLISAMVLPNGYELADIRDPFGNAIDTSSLHAGAVQGLVPYLRLDDPSEALQVDGGTVGWNVISPGMAVSVSVKRTTTRPCSGLLVDGSFVSFDDLPNRTYVLTEEALAALGGCSVSAVCTADWHMAEDGNDADSGFTPGTAKKTFANMMACVAAGDTVHLAAGTYGDNAGADAMTVELAADKIIRSRVVVPAGVILEGAGRDETIIEGKDSGATAVQGGCGPDAMTCVFLNGASAIVRNCTLRNGHTQLLGESSTWKNYDQDMGAGVASLKSCSSTARAENCTIRGNVAGRGAGAYYVTLVNCIVADNEALENAGAGNLLYAYNTVFRNNRSVSLTLLAPYGLDNCSIVSNITSSTKGVDLAIQTQKPAIRNTIIAGSSSRGSTPPSLLSRCLIATDGKSGYLEEADSDGTCIYTNLAAMVTDLDGRPVIGQNAGIGMANESYYDFEKFGAYDLSGAPRVMNGVMDIGALEADYRPLYQKAIGMKRGAVVDVTRGVLLADDDSIKLFGGDVLSARWEHKMAGKCSVVVTIAESGSLTVKRNGVVLETVVGPVAAHEVAFSGLAGEFAADQLEVSFSGEGLATFSVCDVSPGLILIFR